MKTKAFECVELGAVYSEWNGKTHHWASVDFGRCSPTTYQLSIMSCGDTPEQAENNLEKSIAIKQPEIEQWLKTKGSK